MNNWLKNNISRILFVTGLMTIAGGIAMIQFYKFIGIGIATAGLIIIIDLYMPGK
jgi:hypothetical protein